MTLENIIGYVACVNVTLLQLPQVVKTYQSKKADDLSWGMIFLNLFASVIWFIYGLIISKMPIIIANCCYFVANITIIAMKVKYKTVKGLNDKNIDQHITSNI